MLTILLSGFILVFGFTCVEAYQVEPLIYTIEPSGANSTMRIKITNTNASQVSLELSGLRVTTNESGELNREEEFDDLLIFPMQTSIPPGKAQILQVRYVGEETLDKGRVYAVKIEQLPVELAEAKADVGTQLKIGLTFLSHILVQHSDAAPKLIISDVVKLDDDKLSLAIENIGTGTAILKEMNWSIVDVNNNSTPLNIDDFEFNGFGAQIAGSSKRVITINSDAVGMADTVNKVVAKSNN